MALAEAALKTADEVLFVLPAEFPHKKYGKVGFEDRLRMLLAAVDGAPHYSVASTDGGLFIEIAREVRREYAPDVALSFLCGRDAAERIVNWDYGRPGAFLEQLREFELLVAPRGGDYEPPPEMRDRIHALRVPPGVDVISGTNVRERIARGLEWKHLVPDAIVPLVEEIYGRHEQIRSH